MVSYILNSVLKKFVKEEGLAKTKVNFALSEIKLSDLELLPAALDFLDLPGVAVRYGRVGSLALSIPGGALAWLVSKKEPISVTISDVHILVDKVVPVPGEAGLKALAAKTAALDLDAAVYRQQVADWIQDALSDSAASAAVRSGAPKSLVEAVLYKLHVRVERVHVRYEDRTSAAASPFAAGVTLDSLSLSTDEPAVIAGSDTPSRRHRAAMGCLAVYWDPLAPGGGYLEAGGDGRATYSAFDGGIARADAPPPPHCYVVEPLSTDLRAVRSSGGSATLATPSAGPPSPGAAESAPPPLPPALSATLAIPALRLCLSRMQMLQATFLGKWVADQSALRLRDELKGEIPPVLGSPQLQAWHRAVTCVVKLHRRQPRAGGVPRWDRTRLLGSLRRRSEYIAAFGAVLAREAALLEAARRGAAELASDAAKLAAGVDSDATAKAAAATVRMLEAELLYEQVVDFRIEARVAFEEARAARAAAKASSPSSWGSWFGAAPALPPATAAAASFDAAARKAQLQAALVVAESDSETLRLHLVLGDVTLTLRTGVPAAASAPPAGDAPWIEPRLVTFSLAGSAGLSQRRSGSWAVNLRLKTISAVDDVTAGSAYPQLISPRLATSSTVADGPDARAAVVPQFFKLEFEQIPVDRRSALTRLRVDSQPLEIVIVPALVRGLASFALSPATAALSSGVTAELATLSSRAPADVYAILAQRQCFEIHANLAAPTFILPDDPLNASGGEARFRLGELVIDSEPVSAEPITLGAAVWPPEFDASLLDVLEGGSRVLAERDLPGTASLAQQPESTPAEVAAAAVGVASPLPSPTRRAQSVGEQALAASAYDSWQVRLSNMSLDVVGPCNAPGLTRQVTPVIHPVSVGVRIQMSFLSRAQQPEALRVKAVVNRIAAVSSLALAQRAMHLQRTAFALLADLDAISEQLLTEFNDVSAHNVTASAAGAVWEAPAVGSSLDATSAPSTKPGAPASPPGSIIVDVRFDELSLLVYDVRRVVRAVIERRTSSTLPEPFCSTAAAILLLPPAPIEASASEFSVALSALAATAELAPSGIAAVVSLGSCSVVDRFQHAGDAFSQFVESSGPGSAPGAPLLQLKAQYSALNNSTGAGPRARVQLDAGSLFVSYNPETVAALQWYSRFLVECISLAAPEEKSTPARGRSPQSPAVVAPAPDAPDAAQQLGGLLTFVAPIEDDVVEGDVATIREGLSPRPLQIAASACFGRFVLVLQKETQQRKIARIVVAGLALAASHTGGSAGGMLAEVELSEVAVLVLTGGASEAALFRTPCSVDRAVLVERAPLSPPSEVTVAALSPLAPSWLRPGCALRLRFQQWASPTAGLDLKVQLGIAPLGSVLALRPTLELVDYAQRGLVKSLLAAAGASTGSSLAQAKSSDSRMLLEFAIQSAHVEIPGAAGDALAVDLGALVVEGKPAPDQPFNELTVGLGAIVVSTAEAGSSPQSFLHSSSDARVELRVPLGAPAAGELTLDASVDLPGISVTVTDSQLLLAHRVVLGQLGPAASGSAHTPPPPPSEPQGMTSTFDTSWLGISYGSAAAGSETRNLDASAQQPSPMRVRINMLDGVNVALRPARVASAVIASLGHLHVAIDVDNTCVGSMELQVALDRLHFVEERREADTVVRADMLCPVAASVEKPVSAAPDQSIFGVSGITPEVRGTAELSKHVCLRFAIDPRENSSLVELAVMHTMLNPSPTGLVAILALTQVLSTASAAGQLLTPPGTCNDAAGAHAATTTMSDAILEIDNDAPSAKLELIAPPAHAEPSAQVERAGQASRIDARVLLVGIALVLPAKQFSLSPAAVVNFGAEAWVSLRGATPTTPRRLTVKAGTDLMVYTHPAVVVREMPSLEHRSSVLDRLAVFADVDVTGNASKSDAPLEQRTVSVRAGCVQLYVRPSLLRAAMGVFETFTVAGLVSHAGPPDARDVPPSAQVPKSSPPSNYQAGLVHATDSERPTFQQSRGESLARPSSENYALSWKGLVIQVGRGCDDTSAMLIQATVDPVQVAVHSTDGMEYNASASLSLQVHSWSSDSSGWDAVTLQPWGFDAVVRARLGDVHHSPRGDPRVQVDVVARSDLLVRLVDVRVQELLSGSNEWQRLTSALSPSVEPTPTAHATSFAEPSAQFQPVLQSPLAGVELLPAKRNDLLGLAIHFPVVSVELAMLSSSRGAAPLVKLLVLGLRTGFGSTDFGSISGTTVVVSVAGLHVLDFLAVSSPEPSLLLSSSLEIEAQRYIFSAFSASHPLVSDAERMLSLSRVAVADSSAVAALPVDPTPFVEVSLVSLSAPCPSVLCILAPGSTSDDALETTSARVRLNDLRANLRASTLREVLKFLASAFRVADAAPTLNPGVTQSTQQRPASSLLLPPSATLATRVQLSVRSISVGLHSDAQGRVLATAEVEDAVTDVRIFKASSPRADNSGTAISGAIGTLRVVDASFPDRSHRFSGILSPEVPSQGRTYASSRDPLVTFALRAYGSGADVRASTCVSAAVRPVRVIFFAKRISDITDVISLELARLAAPASGGSARGPTSLQLALFDGACDAASPIPVPPSAIVDLHVSLQGLELLLPVAPATPAAASVRISSVEVRSHGPTYVSAKEATKSHLASCALPDDGELPDDLVLPVDGLRVEVTGLHVGVRAGDEPWSAILTQGSVAPGTEGAIIVQLRRPLAGGILSLAWVANGLAQATGSSIVVSVPPLTLTLKPTDVHLLRHVVDGNLSAVPQEAAVERQQQLCSRVEMYLPEPSRAARETARAAVRCAQCSAVFGVVVPATQCDVCGAATCFACLAGRAFDAEAARAKECCGTCWAELEGTRDPVRVLELRVDDATSCDAVATADEGAPLMFQLLLDDLSLTLSSPGSPVCGDGQISYDSVRTHDLVRLHMSCLRVKYTSSPPRVRSTESRAVSHVSVGSVTLVDVRPTPAGITATSPAARVLFSADTRALRRATSAHNVSTPALGANHIEVIFTSRTTAGCAPRAECQVLLMHCDIHPDPGALQAVASFFDGYAPPTQAAAPSSAERVLPPPTLRGNTGEVWLRRRTPPATLSLALNVINPRIILLETLQSVCSRALLITFSAHVQYESVAADPVWGLVASHFDPHTPAVVLRCRRQQCSSKVVLHLGELAVAVTRLVRSSAVSGSFALSSFRTAILTPAAVNAESSTNEFALLSIGCSPLARARESNLSAASADVSISSAFASTASAAQPRQDVTCVVEKLQLSLAYTDALLAGRIFERLLAGQDSDVAGSTPTEDAKKPVSDNGRAVVDIALAGTPMRVPDTWHSGDYEVVLPVDLNYSALFTTRSFGHHALPKLTHAPVGSATIPTRPAVVTVIVADPPLAHDPSDTSRSGSVLLDCGSGIVQQAPRALWEAWCSLVKTGDVLVAVAGKPVTGLADTEVAELLASARGSEPTVIRLRMRRARISVAIAAHGAEIVLVNNAGGSNDPLLSLEIGRVAFDAFDGSAPARAAVGAPALESSYVSASLSDTALSFFNPRVGELEPLVEPFQLSGIALSIDFGSSWIAKQHAPASGRPLRSVDLRVSPVELVASHTAIATLCPAFKSLERASRLEWERLVQLRAALADGTSDAAEDDDADLGSAQEYATELVPGDPGALQTAIAPAGAFPILFRNSSGFPAVVCVDRCAEGHAVVLFSAPRFDSAFGGQCSDAQDSAIHLGALCAAVADRESAQGEPRPATIGVPSGSCVGIATASSRDALGTAPAVAVSPGTGLVIRSAEETASVFPALRIYAGADVDQAVKLPPLGLIPSFFCSAQVTPRPGAARLPTIVEVSSPVAARRVVDLRSCAVLHNACGLAMEVFLGTGTVGSPGLCRVGIVAARETLYLPTPPPGVSLSGLRVRPLAPASESPIAASGRVPQYSVSGVMFFASEFAAELLCPPLEASDGLPIHIAVVARRSASGAPPLLSVLLFAPIILTSALPVPIVFRLGPLTAANVPPQGGPAVLQGTLAPGETRELFGVSGGSSVGRLLTPDDLSVLVAKKPEPALGIQVPRVRATPLQLLTRNSLDFSLEPDVDGTRASPACIHADVRREEPCTGAGATVAALAAPGDGETRSRRVVVTVFADAWISNITGLPLTIGQTRPGFCGVEGTEGSIVPCGHQFGDLVECDELYENERFAAFFDASASALLLTDPFNFSTAADPRTSCRREDFEARLPAGWTWIGEWQVEPWDHEFDFGNFTNGRHDFNPDRRTHDYVRRRRHYRLRSFARDRPEGTTRHSPGVVPSYVVKQPPSSEGSAALTPLQRTPKIVSGSSVGAPDADAEVALLSLPADAKAFLRLLSGPWSDALVLSVSSGPGWQRFGVSGPPDPAPLGGISGGATYTPVNRCHIVAHVAEAPAPFRGPPGVASRVVTLRAAVTLVNATGAPLFWRQADSGRSDTRDRAPLRTVLAGSLAEHELAPGASTPVWHDVEGDGRGLLLSPEAARGGWSPPLNLHEGERRFAVVVPVAGSGVSGGVVAAYVASALGPSPAGALILGVTVRSVPDVPGCFVAVAALHTPRGHIMRPPASVLRSAAAAAAVSAALSADASLGSIATASQDDAPAQPPFLCVVNYSRSHVGFQQTSPRAVFSEHGRCRSAGDGAAPVLGPVYAESVIWAPPLSAIPLGLTSPAEFKDVELRVRVVEARTGAVATSSLVDDSPLASGTVSLRRVGQNVVLRTGGDTIVVVRVILRGPVQFIVIHDDSTLGKDLLQLLVAAAPRGGANGAEAFELTAPRIPAWAAAAYGTGFVGDAENVAPLLADAVAAIAAADKTPWVGNPEFSGSVWVTPPGDEVRWTAATAALPRFEFPHSRGPGRLGTLGLSADAWDTALSVSVASLGVSLVDSRPAESLYFSVAGLSASAVLTGAGDELALSVASIQLDDAADDAEFPVVLCKARVTDSAASAEPMLGLSVISAPHSGWTHLRSVRGRLFPVRVCASTRFGVAAVQLLLGFQRAAAAPSPPQSFSADPAASLDPLTITGGFPLMLTEGGPAARPSNAAAAAALAALHASCIRALLGDVAAAAPPSALLAQLARPGSSAPLFVEHLEPLGPRVSAIVDVRVSRDSGLDRLLGVSPFVSLVMQQLAGLEFEGARLDFRLDPQASVVGGPAELLGPVQAELGKQGAAQAFRLLGALKGFSAPAAVLESAYASLASVGSGDVLGAVSGVKGVATGAVSTVAGGVATITGAIGSVAAAANTGPGGKSASARSLAARRDTASSGVQSAGWQLFGGLTGAFTGLVTKPLEGFREGTASGVAKGVAAGLVGVVASPVEGIFGAVTTGLRGVEQSLRSEDVRVNEWRRLTPVRPPRPLHGLRAQLRPYDAVEAIIAKHARDSLGPAPGPGGAPESVVLVAEAEAAPTQQGGKAKVAGPVVVSVTTARVFILRRGGAPPIAWSSAVDGARAAPDDRDASGCSVTLAAAALSGGGGSSPGNASSSPRVPPPPPLRLVLDSPAAARLLVERLGHAGSAWRPGKASAST